MNFRILGFICGLSLAVGFSGYGQLRIPYLNDEDKGKELGYMFAFSQATKFYIFGDYARAASLYNECLKYQPQSSAVHYQLADLYLKSGDLKSAHAYSNFAWKSEPDNKWYALQLANIFQAELILDSAVYMLKTLLNGSDKDINIYYQIAAMLEKRGLYKESIENLNKIEQKMGSSRETAISKSRIFEKMGMKRESLIELKSALTGREDDYVVIGLIAEYFRRQNRIDSAEFYYKKILSSHINDANIVVSYGEFLIEQEKIKEARILFSNLFNNREIEDNIKLGFVFNALQDRKIFVGVKPVLDTIVDVLLKNFPSSIRVMSLYSDANYRMGNYNKSSIVLRRIIEREPDNYSAWEQLLFCESAMEKRDSVIYFGERAIERFDKRPLAYLILASAFYRDGNVDKALDFLRRGEVFADSDALKIEFYSLLAECYGKKKDSDKAEKFYQGALLIDSLNVSILNNYAYSLAVRGVDLERAESMSKYTVEIEKLNPTYLDTYAWILFKRGNLKEAKRFIEKAVYYGGNENAEVLDHYGDILFKIGRQKKAVLIWNTALKFAEEDMKKSLLVKINGL
jgi:tetratricopeptide (TPR) repeat protein